VGGASPAGPETLERHGRAAARGCCEEPCHLSLHRGMRLAMGCQAFSGGSTHSTQRAKIIAGPNNANIPLELQVSQMAIAGNDQVGHEFQVAPMSDAQVN